MNTLSRYILVELLKVFFLTLAILTLLLLFVGIAQQAIKEGIGLIPVIKLAPYLLPNALRFAVPGTMLLTVCCVYGRISASHEFTAIKALGISPMTLIWPGLILAGIVSMFAVWLNDVAVSWGHEGARRVIIESIEEVAYGMLKTQKSFSSPRLSIMVKEVRGNRLIQPEILIPQSDHTQELAISAEEAILESDATHFQLLVTLKNSRFEFSGKGQGVYQHPGLMTHAIPLEDQEEYRLSISPSNLALSEINSNLSMHHKILKQRQESFAALSTMAMLSGNFHQMHNDRWAHLVSEVNWSYERINRVKTEPYRRWTNGFSCLFFAMLGIPLAIVQKKSDWIATFFSVFLPVLLIFYPLLAYGVDRAKDGAMHPCAVGLGNLVLFLLGLILLRRVQRY